MQATTRPGTIRTGLIGSGIGPSLSPALHEREAAALGLPLRYLRWDLDELGAADVGTLLGRARAAGYRGLNITHPCKQLVIEHLDALSPDAAAIGAVNTVVIGSDGSLTGHNTDWTGFRDGLRDGLSGAAMGDVVLLGAGGAGAAAGYALVRGGVRHLHVVDVDAGRAHALAHALSERADTGLGAQAGDRTASATADRRAARAETVAEGLTGRPTPESRTTADRAGHVSATTEETVPCTTFSSPGPTPGTEEVAITGHGRDELDALLHGADGVVHATPIGMAAHPGLPFDARLLAARPWVAEIVYRPLDTALLRAAQAAGCRTVDGGRMAVHQAAEAFRLFTGHTPDPARMLGHLAELVDAEGRDADRVA